MTTETKWHLTPPSAGMVWQTQLSLSQLRTRHHLHLPSLKAVIWFCTFGPPTSTIKPIKPTTKSSLTYLPSPSFNNELLCDVRSPNPLAQLPVCRLSITSNRPGQRRWRLNRRSGSSGVLPIVLLLTWSMWLIVFASSLVGDASEEELIQLVQLPIKTNWPPIYHFHKGWNWHAPKHTHTHIYSAQYTHARTGIVVFRLSLLFLMSSTTKCNEK